MITTYTDRIGRVGMAPFGKPHTVYAGPGGKARVARWKTSFDGDTNTLEYACFNTHRQCVGHTLSFDEVLVFLQTGIPPKRQRRRIILTAEQWKAFSREKAHDDDSALQACCANISDLRTVILRIAQVDGVLATTDLEDLKMHWDFCKSHFDGRPVWKTLRSLIEQAGLEWDCGEG